MPNVSRGRTRQPFENGTPRPSAALRRCFLPSGCKTGTTFPQLGLFRSLYLQSLELHSYKNKLYVGISLVAPCCHHTFLLCVCKLPRQKT